MTEQGDVIPDVGRARARRFAALVRKETRHVVRDPRRILIAFVLPLVLLFIFGYGVSLDASRIRVGLVIEKSTPVTRDLAASFQASRFFDVVIGRDSRAFEEDLVLGRIRGILIIPATFAKNYTGH